MGRRSGATVLQTQNGLCLPKGKQTKILSETLKILAPEPPHQSFFKYSLINSWILPSITEEILVSS